MRVCVCVAHAAVLVWRSEHSLRELVLSFLWGNPSQAAVVRLWRAPFHLYLLSGPISPSFLFLKTRSHAPQTGLRLDK